MGIIGRLLGTDRGAGDLGALGRAERQLVRSGLAPLDRAQPGLAARAQAYVLTGDDPEVLLLAPPTQAGQLLGGPGRLRWQFHALQPDPKAQEAARTALQARSRLYRGMPTPQPPELLDALVRLGRLFAAVDGGTGLDDPGAGAPPWLQYLVNDAVFASHTGRQSSIPDGHQPPGVDVPWVAALLEHDGSPDVDLALRIGFERKGLASYYQNHLTQLTRTPAAGRFLLEHPDAVHRVAPALSADSRTLLAGRLGDDPALVLGFTDLIVRLAVDTSKQVRAAGSQQLDKIPVPQRVSLLTDLLRDGSTAQRKEAAGLLARVPAATALQPLQQALESESSKPVQQALREAVARLTATEQAQEVRLPQALPWQPYPDAPLGDRAFEALVAQREEAVAKAREQAETEAVQNEGRERPFLWMRRRYDDLRKLSDHDLRAVVALLDGRDGAAPQAPSPSTRNPRTLGRTPALGQRQDVRAVVDQGTRLQSVPGFGPPHLIRWVAAKNNGTFWRDPTFQQWLRAQPEGSVDLRAIAAVWTRGGAAPDEVARAFLVDSYWGSSSPLDQVPPERTWPFFADFPQYLEQGLGLKEDDLTGENRYRTIDLGLTLRALATFPALPPRWVPVVMEIALGEARTHRPAAQQALSGLPDLGSRVAESLTNGSSAVRTEAAAWLARLGDPAAVPALERALAAERRETVRAALLTALEALGEDISAHLAPAVLLAEAVKGLKAKVPVAIDWFPLESLPACRWADGDEVDPRVPRWWVVLAARLKEPSGNALLTRYLGLLDPASRAALGEAVLRQFIARDTAHPSVEEADAHARANAPATHQRYQQWHTSSLARVGAGYSGQYDLTLEQITAQLREAKLGEYLGSAIAAKGVLALAVGAPGHVAVDLVRTYTRNHYTRRAQLEAMLEALAGSDDPAVIQLLLGISRRYRTASVQQKALDLVAAVAERRGWSQDQLADRTIPSAGLDETGTLVLSFGEREFAVTLDAAMKPVLRTTEGKVVKALPAPRQDEDAAVVKEAKQQLTAHKKELKQVLELQTARLFEAMCTDRTWPAEDWTAFLQQHPVAGRLVQRLVWLDLGPAPVDGQEPLPPRGFRPSEDGSLLDAADEEVELAEGSVLRLAHASLLDEPQRSAWRAHLADYRVTPLFDQLSHLPPDLPATDAAGRPTREVTDRQGWVSDTFTLRGAFTKRGYQRDQAEDGGVFYRYTKPFTGVGLRVVVEFTGSMLPEENVPAALRALTIEDAGSSGWDARVLPLAEVPPVLLAEAYADYLAVAGVCAGFDPQWEKVAPW